MPTNLQVTFRDMDPPLLAEQRIRERVERLERLHPRITSCHVVVETPPRHHRKGVLYAVSIDLAVPGGELVVNKNQNDKHAHEDFFVAMRDAFNAMEKQLRGFAARGQGRVKTHEVPPHGTVSKLFLDYGFITDSAGQEVYFHANSVVDGQFDELDVGAQVRFVAAEGESEKGPQATTVRLIGKHHLP